MATKRNKPNVGRDPTMGMLSFKTGVIKDRKRRKTNRRDKYGKREIARQLRGE